MHLLAGYVLMAALLLRLYWGFAGNQFARWSRMIPLHKRNWTTMLGELKSLLFPWRAFKVHTGHAPLANISYLAVYLGIALAALTGMILNAQAHYTPAWRAFADWGLWLFAGNLNAVRLVHHAMLWFFAIFFLVHLYLAVYTLSVTC
ncbi:MAG: cytochrome b/b6 domain-containing protein, partial [Candidatus Xenobia bacterium]